MKSYSMVVVLGWLLFSVYGCASQGRVVQASAIRSPLAEYASIVISIRALEEKYEPDARVLEEKVLLGLKRRSLFQEVLLSTDAKATAVPLWLGGTIENARRVSGVARVMFGMFAGRAKFTVAVALRDARQGKSLGDFTVEGKSSGGSIFAGGTDQASEKVSEQIVDFIQQHLHATSSPVIQHRQHAQEGKAASSPQQPTSSGGYRHDH